MIVVLIRPLSFFLLRSMIDHSFYSDPSHHSSAPKPLPPPKCEDVSLVKGDFTEEAVNMIGESTGIILALSPAFQTEQLAKLCESLAPVKLMHYN